MSPNAAGLSAPATMILQAIPTWKKDAKRSVALNNSNYYFEISLRAPHRRGGKILDVSLSPKRLASP